MQLDQHTWFTLRAAMCDGICRPLGTSPELPKTWARYGTQREAAHEHRRALAQRGEDPVAGSSASAVAIGAASCPVHAP